MRYIRVINLNEQILKINKLKNKIYKKRNIVKKSKNSQLDYIKTKHNIRDIEFKLIGWKVLSFVVAIISALNIIRTEPITIFGITFRFSLILFVIVLNIIFGIVLNKIGVEV